MAAWLAAAGSAVALGVAWKHFHHGDVPKPPTSGPTGELDEATLAILMATAHILTGLEKLGGPYAGYFGFQALTGFPLTLATIRWGMLRIVPCFAYGCALHSLWRERPGDSATMALAGALFSGAAVLTLASSGAPDALIVTGLGGLIFFLARLAQTGSELFSARPLVYLGEISYSVYMVCIPWKIVFVNGVNRIFELNSEHLPLGLWLVLLFGVIPLAALSYHLVEKPARAWMKLAADSAATRRPSAARA